MAYGRPAVNYAQTPVYQGGAAPAVQYAQAPMYQAAAAPVQYAQAAQAQYAQPYQGFGAVAPAYSSPYAATNDKIVKLLGSAGSGNFRKGIKPFFDEASFGS